MSSITLTNATRTNLLSLQQTAELMSRTQTNLANGKRVNSALDNPVNFFSAASMTGRASDLSSIIDGISNHIQTIHAAMNGIESISKLVKVGEVLIDRAARSPSPIISAASVTSLGSQYTVSDIVGSQNATAPRPVEAANASTKSNFDLQGRRQTTNLVIDYSSGKIDDGDKVTFTQGNVTRTFTYHASGSSLGQNEFHDDADLRSLMLADTSFKFTSVDVKSGAGITFTTADDTEDVVTTSDPALKAFDPGSPTTSDADYFIYTVNGVLSQRFTFRDPADPANGYFNNRASLVAAVNAVSDPSALRAEIDPVSNVVRLTAADKDDTFTLTGAKINQLGYVTDPYVPPPSLDDTSVTYSIGKGIEQKSVTVNYVMKQMR